MYKMCKKQGEAKDPNDASHIVWAICKSFLLFFMFYTY